MTDAPRFGGHTLAELRALHERATPGPWEAHKPARWNSWNGAHIRATGLCVATLPQAADRPLDQKEADAQIIAAARNALPDLLSAAERAGDLQARIDGLEAMLVDAAAAEARMREALRIARPHVALSRSSEQLAIIDAALLPAQERTNG